MSIFDFLKPKPQKTCPYCKQSMVGKRWSPSTPVDELEYLCMNNQHEYRLVYKKNKLLFVQMTFSYRNKHYLLSIDYPADLTCLEEIVWTTSTFDYLPISIQEVQKALPFNEGEPITSGYYAMKRLLNLAVFS